LRALPMDADAALGAKHQGGVHALDARVTCELGSCERVGTFPSTLPLPK